MKHTALNSVHKKLKAKMVQFAGWEMPLLYSGIQKEHLAVRKKAGLFDVSHMGELLIKGREAEDFLSWVLPNNIRKVEKGSAFYTHILNHDGIVIDDTIGLRFDKNEFLLVPNAANTEKVKEWFKSQKKFEVEILDRTMEIACLALQGPVAELIPSTLPFVDFDLKRLPFFGFTTILFKGEKLTVSRTGYTGEDGFELYIPWKLAVEVWNALFEVGEPHGLEPCGLGARDSLRLEKGFLLSGTDFNMDRTILETGWEKIVDWNKDFMGKEALLKQKERGDYQVFKGFVMKEKGIPRHGCRILNKDGKVVGVVTSGTLSPCLRKGIALGYIRQEMAEEGKKVLIEIRDKRLEAEVV
ncbi:MAG TPA: glycine cleavage system aminomethyltransferase GcvT, partial [Thermoplasmata archaeon]|nr:glycine cleavage system aminomethyltransferase GcvT [Thermoplasmata archaeon]